MADHSGNEKESKVESVMDKITEKFHGDDSSSSSDSDGEKSPSPSSVKAKIYRLFGREKPVHKVLGGGKRTKANQNLSFSVSNYIRFMFLIITRLYTYVGSYYILGVISFRDYAM